MADICGTGRFDPKKELELDKKVLQMLEAQLKKELAAADRERERRAKAHENALEDFRSREEINDAYGYGFINARQQRRLLDAWDDSHKPDTSRDDFIKYLTREIRNTKSTMREMEFIIGKQGKEH